MDKQTLLEDRDHGNSMFPFTVYSVDYLDKNVIFNLHWHPELEFIYIEKGPVNFQVGSKKYTLQSHSGFFVPSEQLHGAYPCDNKPFLLHAIVFHIDFIRSFGHDLIELHHIEHIQSFSQIHARLLNPSTSKKHTEIIQVMKDIIHTFKKQENYYELKIKGYLYLLLEVFFQAHSFEKYERVSSSEIKHTELLKKVLKFINVNYNKNIKIAELASLVQMSEGHFSRFFKSFVQMTPIEYINNIRINRACMLLQESDRLILDIALDVGFTNQSHFNRLFKKIKGCTPKEFKIRFEKAHST